MNRAKKVIVITGVPGTGKTTLTDSLKKKLSGAEVIRASDVINGKRLAYARSRDGTKIVDMRKLKAELDGRIRKSKKRIIIIESHLLCDITIKDAVAIVLRERLATLRKRLEKRGYDVEKVRENLISEATDYCGVRSERHYRPVFEIFGARRSTQAEVIGIIKGKKTKGISINLLPELQKMMKKDKTLIL